MNNEIKEILDFKENADYKKLSCDEIAILKDYIINLQKENERLREELNGKQLQEIHKINNYDYFKEMTNNWNREDFSRRCYDLCNEKVDLQQENEELKEETYKLTELWKNEVDKRRKAVEYIKEQYKWIEESDKRWQPVLDNKKILNILNGKE